MSSCFGLALLHRILGQPCNGQGVVDELHLFKRSASEITCLSHHACLLGVWNKRNARVFHNVVTMPTIVIEIRGEMALWSLAGAKNLGSILQPDNLFIYRASIGCKNI
jgi:hypothetical protein